MQKFKKIHTGVGYLALLIIAALVIALYYFIPNQIASLANINWLALAFVVIIAVTPLGSKKLKAAIENPPKKKEKEIEPLGKLPTKSWLSKIFLLQISLGLIYYGTATMVGLILPFSKTSHPHAFAEGLNQVLLHNGLFPWALIALFAVSFGLIAFIRNQDSYFNDIIIAPFKKVHHDYKVIIDNIGRSLSYCGLAFCLVIASIALATLVAGQHTMTAIMGLKAGSMGAVILMFALTYRRSTNPSLQAVQTEKPNLGIIVNLIIWGVLLGAVAIVIHFMAAGKGSTLPSNVLAPILKNGWELHWHIFTAGLLFCFVPLLSLYTARYSYGYSLRAMIMATLALPLLAAVLVGFNQHFHLITQLPYAARLAEGAAIIGTIILFYLVCQKKTVSITNLIYLPKPGTIKARNLQNFIYRIKRFAGVLFYLFIPASIFVTSLFLIIAIITCTFVAVLAMISLVSLLRRK